MSNPYYDHTTYPNPNAPGASAALRAELELISAGFDKLPTLAGNANKLVVVNATGDALEAVATLPNLSVLDSSFFVKDNLDNTKQFQFQASGITAGATRVITVPDFNLTLVGLDSIQTLTNKTLTAPVINTAVISGGTADSLVIGGTTAAAGTFTSVTASSATVGGAAVVTLSATQTLTNKTISGGTVTGAAVTGLSTPSGSSDATTKSYVDTADALKLNLSGGTMSGAIAMNTNKITGLGTPTADADAATKAYVDGVAQGLDIKASVVVATTGNITLSGTQTIDGVSLIAGQRVLVKDQSAQAGNGIYLVAAGSWTRTTDMDAWTEFPGAFVFVEQGTVNDNSGWVCTVSAGGTLGSTAVTFEQFSGAGQITAGTGMTKTGNTLNVNTASSARIVVGADEIDLATTGVAASTYRSVTVDQWGRVTAGTNPTTISGYGITNAYTKTEVDTALALKLNLAGGTMSGNIAMGGNKVTGLGAPTASADAVTLDYVTTLYGSTASAAVSAADALTYKNAAESAATTATTQASTATTQAGIATTQAGIATTQAGIATTAANNAEAAWDQFDDRYLGAKSTPPIVDNDGNPLVIGALYFDTTGNLMKVYSSSGWVNAGSAVNGTSSRATYTATASQTTFAITYDPGFVDVYLNGLKLEAGVEFTATNGTSVVLATGATAGDIVDIVAYGTFVLSNMVSKAGDTMTGSLALPAGTVSAPAITTSGDTNTGIFFPSSDTIAASTGGTERMRIDSSGRLLVGTTTAVTQSAVTPRMQLSGIDNNTSSFSASQYNNSIAAPILLLNKSRGASAGSYTEVSSGDFLGRLLFSGADGTAFIQAASIAAQVDGTPGTNDMPGRLVFSTTADGASTPTERLRIDSAGNINIATAGARITGDFSNATVANRVMFQTSTANAVTQLRIIPNGTGNAGSFQVGNSSDPSNSSVAIIAATSTEAQLISAVNGTGTFLPMTFYTGGSERMRVDTSGNVLVGTTTSASGYIFRATGKTLIGDNTNVTPDANWTGQLTINGSGYTGGLALDVTGMWVGHNSSARALLFATDETERMRIDSSGNVGIGTSSPTERLHVTGNILASGNITAFSDARLKTDVQTISDALALVERMRGVRYTKDGSASVGVIAQEMREVLPEVVHESGEYLSVAYGNIVGVLIEAVKELTARVKELEAK
jgi:hypothetical protein